MIVLPTLTRSIRLALPIALNMNGRSSAGHHKNRAGIGFI